ncbi:MAG TPA: elongation factor G [Acidimicrobiales bacterium]|nr:elongation factor G [Acidimicrobiales bacterium]
MSTDPTAIRNVALVGHHGAGKTTLAEALLAATGAIARRGSVEKGTTTCDSEPEEISRQLSVTTALAPFVVNGIKVNLLDTPGYADFHSEVLSALRVVDLAVVVVSASDGVQAQTEDAWRAAARLGLPRVLVINKLDRERSDFERTLDEMRSIFGAGVAPVELPIGTEADFHGVIDLLGDTATHYETPAAGAAVDGTVPPAGHEGPVPPDLVDLEHSVHEQLVEGIVVGDDGLMERYLAGEAIDYSELEKSLAGGVASGTVFPVLCCSGLTGVGVDRLARLIEELCPPPGSRPPLTVEAGSTTTEVPCDPSGPTLLSVVKTFSDNHSGTISLCKVHSGTLNPDDVLINTRSRNEERLHALTALCGHNATPTTRVVAGDFVALPRLNGTHTGDTLAPKGQPVRVLGPDRSAPALRVAVTPVSRSDDDKLMSALQRLCDEDPALTVSREDETHQTILGVNGEVHLAVTLERLSRKSNVHVEREELRIPYRETITVTAQAEGKHKKQSGGHGQFGICHLKLEPLPRGEGFVFHDEVVGGAVPRQYIPAVEKGVLETMAAGGTFGFPVVDIAVTLDDGKAHSVDSNEVSFKMAAAAAIRQAMSEAAPIILEPVSKLEVTVPAANQGDVLGDLHGRRARIVGTDQAAEGYQTVTALVPTAEVSRYAIDLRALTGGRGSFTVAYDHYDAVPDHLAAAIVQAASHP